MIFWVRWIKTWEGYNHYSYLFPYPDLHSKSLDNRDEMNQKFTDFCGYILATKDLRTLRITRITGIFMNETILKSVFFNEKSRARARVGIITVSRDKPDYSLLTRKGQIWIAWKSRTKTRYNDLASTGSPVDAGSFFFTHIDLKNTDLLPHPIPNISISNPNTPPLYFSQK